MTCQLGLMDVPDHDAALAAIHRVLRPGGWFVFVIGHPCVLVPDALRSPRPGGRAAVSITGYRDEKFWRSSNPNRVRRAGNRHVTPTPATYLNGLVRAGFAIIAPTPARTSSGVSRIVIGGAMRHRRRGYGRRSAKQDVAWSHPIRCPVYSVKPGAFSGSRCGRAAL